MRDRRHSFRSAETSLIHLLSCFLFIARQPTTCSSQQEADMVSFRLAYVSTSLGDPLPTVAFEYAAKLTMVRHDSRPLSPSRGQQPFCSAYFTSSASAVCSSSISLPRLRVSVETMETPRTKVSEPSPYSLSSRMRDLL